MTTIDLDRLYEQFLSEASEEDGNFYFVKGFDEELYRRLCKIEGSMVVNIKYSGSELRNVLEYFLRTVYLDAREGNANLQKKDKMPVNPYDFLCLFEKNPDVGIDIDAAHLVRRSTNVYHHEELKNKDSALPKTYEQLCEALESMREVLVKYYEKRYPERAGELKVPPYDRSKQPYDDKMVCAVIDTLDSTSCEKQVLCSKKNERLPNMTQYYLLRVYRASDLEFTEGAIRDEKVLGNLWSNSLNGLPNIVRYSTLDVKYDGEDPTNEKKYIVSYDFGPFKPLPLHAKVIEKLSDEQKYMIMRGIAEGVCVLHHAGIYHRNLQPGSIFVFFDKKTDQVQARLVGFEYSKIDGDLNTVIDSVKEKQKGESSPYFSQGMRKALIDPNKAGELNWQKEDIYSMGAIFFFILTGKEPPAMFVKNTYLSINNPGMRKLLTSMLSMNGKSRPDADTVEQELDKYISV